MIACIKTQRFQSEPMIRGAHMGLRSFQQESRISDPGEYLNDQSLGDVVTYGILRGSRACQEEAHRRGKSYYRMDHPHFFDPRPHPLSFTDTAWFRISKDNHHDPFQERPADRWEQYFKGRIQIDRWKPTLKNAPFLFIPVEPPTDQLENMEHVNADLYSRIQECYPGRKIIIRNKASARGIDLYSQARGCSAVIAPQSNVGVLALSWGIPVHCTEHSVCHEWSTPIDRLDNPDRKDRMPLFHHIAYCQWMGREIRKGIAWRYYLES